MGWGFSCCSQTAVIQHLYLLDVAEGHFQPYREGIFCDWSDKGLVETDFSVSRQFLTFEESSRLQSLMSCRVRHLYVFWTVVFLYVRFQWTPLQEKITRIFHEISNMYRTTYLYTISMDYFYDYILLFYSPTPPECPVFVRNELCCFPEYWRLLGSTSMEGFWHTNRRSLLQTNFRHRNLEQPEPLETG